MAKAYAYPSDVPDEEWTFVLPYLLLSTEDSGARRHPLVLDSRTLKTLE